ncbi:MAG TPA: T9SS type A sorting domain-containing protein, partial [Flavobacteriales bacterium]|nr:T9SS type A sorting domain-containing protein [Flavobacteriales bacterium]
EWPVLVVGHGFVMGTDAYANLWNHFVPRGYIVALPATETGFSPSHSNFGLDIAFVASALQAANSEAASPFFQRVAPTSALMGHSMGGGSSFLGAANNTSITTVVNFAAAETNPSAVAACAQVQVPTLMFAGGNDCVTPIPQHQQPMYNALTVPCRAFVNILGGGHCYFADFNFNCNFGELTCTPAPAISRAAQQEVVNDFATLWLDHFLKGDDAAVAAFIDSTSFSTRVTAITTCELSTSINEAAGNEGFVWATLVDDRISIRSESPARVELFNAQGVRVLSQQLRSGAEAIDVRSLATGSYLLALEANGARSMQRVVIAR